MIYATKLVVFWEFISSLSENFLTIFLLTTMTNDDEYDNDHDDDHEDCLYNNHKYLLCGKRCG